ncbi:hypothetical protein [Nodularia sp. UHCC 0506]|nr:hypothetical protein [Nodularia sp. UHCC 0506]MEA5513432.1 hypothetical protein [Nodularia sp. UHCC 0506]
MTITKKCVYGAVRRSAMLGGYAIAQSPQMQPTAMLWRHIGGLERLVEG